MTKQSSAQLFRCYIWLVDTIYTAGHISRADIDRKWAQNYTLNDLHESAIPERTFHNWRHAIEDLFQINIECDRKLGRTYYIEDADDLERGGVRQWLILCLFIPRSRRPSARMSIPSSSILSYQTSSLFRNSVPKAPPCKSWNRRNWSTR